MLENLLTPFYYSYMVKAILVSSGTGAICAFLSCFLMLRGWSLIGDALSHSIVPGVAIAYYFTLPYAIGAFVSGGLAALLIGFIKQISILKEDAIIGFILSTFFAIGILIISLHPTSIDVQSIILGNILGISNSDLISLSIIILCSVIVQILYWKDLLIVFFDENQAITQGISPIKIKFIFFTMLSVCVVAAFQTVGSILVIAMVVTPGATAYLLTDNFKKLTAIAVLLGMLTCAVGSYLSFFLNVATGGLIVIFQTLLFILVLIFAPKYGILVNKLNRFKQKQSIKY